MPKSVCVNFYDVHGGEEEGKKNSASFQVPNKSDNLDVLANGDNSIEDNAFNVNGGSCVHFAKITTRATASAKLGRKDHRHRDDHRRGHQRYQRLRRHGHLQGLQGH